MKNKKVVVAVDLDGVICKGIDRHYYIQQVMTRKLLPFAKQSMSWLYNHFYVIIYTHRHPFLYFATRRYLRKKGIKYDKLVCGKIKYHLLIDDKAIRFNGWEEFFLQSRLGGLNEKT